MDKLNSENFLVKEKIKLKDRTTRIELDAKGKEKEKELEEIDQKVVGQVDEAVKFAEESKFPDASEALTDVYVQSDYPFILD